MNESHPVVVPVDKVSCSNVHAGCDLVPFDDRCFELSVNSELVVQDFFELEFSLENVLSLISILYHKVEVDVKVKVYSSVCLNAFMDIVEKCVKSIVKVLFGMLVCCCANSIDDHWIWT